MGTCIFRHLRVLFVKYAEVSFSFSYIKKNETSAVFYKIECNLLFKYTSTVGKSGYVIHMIFFNCEIDSALFLNRKEKVKSVGDVFTVYVPMFNNSCTISTYTRSPFSNVQRQSLCAYCITFSVAFSSKDKV